MIFYLGSPTGKLLDRLRERPATLGSLVSRGYLNRVRQDIRWAYDNGAYVDFKRNKSFNDAAFRKDLDRIQGEGWHPEWLVVPDIVEGGMASLDHSLGWLEKLPRGKRWRWMLAVQDGMDPVAVEGNLKPFHGLFVGGSGPFKATLPTWVKLAHEHGKICHLGRGSTLQRLVWAKICDADSADSSHFQYQKDRTAGLIRLADAGWVTPQMFFDFLGGDWSSDKYLPKEGT